MTARLAWMVIALCVAGVVVLQALWMGWAA
jgi:hypothetical protein